MRSATILFSFAPVLAALVSTAGARVTAGDASTFTLPGPNPPAFPFSNPLDAVRYTLSTYFLAVDSKQWDHFGQIFTDDFSGIYGPPVNEVRGWQALAESTKAATTKAISQLEASSQSVWMLDENTAKAVTYVKENYYAVGTYGANGTADGAVVVPQFSVGGVYRDTLVRMPDGAWRIQKRDAGLMVRGRCSRSPLTPTC